MTATLFGTAPRTYEGTHPWISFDARLDFPKQVWLLLGEAHSKCGHVARVPLRPDIARKIHIIYLTKGIHGTASIEGNTLTEGEVLDVIEKGQAPVGKSRDYQEQEIKNILKACNDILGCIHAGEIPDLTVERMKWFNACVLEGLEVEEGVVPGELRTKSVGVRRYRAAPAEDCEYLLERLCEWINGPDFQGDDEFSFVRVIAQAVLAHLYIAWIHPFGDGNGRTARLVEFQLLVGAGLPAPVAHLLSDHYNLTRDRYYQILDRTSTVTPYTITEFFEYALRGFVDGLRAQVKDIWNYQLAVAWENHVHTCFHDQDTPAPRRQKHIALDLPPGEWVKRADLKHISARVAEAYAGKGSKAITRDLNRLTALDLIQRSRQGVRANREVVLGFLPPRHEDGPLSLETELPSSPIGRL